jgi:hypothetical protein
LTLESTTTEPCAIKAPDTSVAAAHPPTPPINSSTASDPTAVWRRMERRGFDALRPEQKIRSAEHYAFFALLAGVRQL